MPGIELAENSIGIAPKRFAASVLLRQRRHRRRDRAEDGGAILATQREKQRTRIASLAESYHGDTVGSMSLGYSETFHRFYKELLFSGAAPYPAACVPLLPAHERGAAALDAAVNEAEETLTANKDTLAALIMEPLMQGAAGMWAQPAGYVQALHDICRRHGILFILDEVATGFGRTGKMFACEHANVAPDLLCLAKGITGGYLPLAATLSTEEIFRLFWASIKNSKLSSTAILTRAIRSAAPSRARIWRCLNEKTRSKTCNRGSSICARGCARSSFHLPHVGDVRQWGYMVGIELVQDKKASAKNYRPEERIGYKVILEARKRGVMIRPLGDVIILMPPLSISDGELTALLDVVHDSIGVVTEN